MTGDDYMKKILYGTFLAITLLSTATGCGEKQEKKAETNIEIDVQGFADDILSQCNFTDSLATVDQSIALTRLYSLDQTQIKECAFYTNSNATAEEIAVIEVISSDYVDDVKAAYETRVENQKKACKDYLPDEMKKLESSVIYTNGNYVVLCVSDDNAKAEDIIKGMFK